MPDVVYHYEKHVSMVQLAHLLGITVSDHRLLAEVWHQ
jgi:hypothetical protein